MMESRDELQPRPDVLQKLSGKTVQVKMISWHNRHGKAAMCMFTPGLYIFREYVRVFRPCESNNRTRKRCFRRKFIGLYQLKICAQDWQNKTKQFGMLEHFPGRPVEPAQLSDEFLVGQVVSQGFSHRDVRGVSA